MPTLIKLACPNCGYNLAEENLHSNILQCPRCNSYTYYESGMFNVNVFFGLLKSHTYELDGLRSAIIEKYVNQGSLKAIRSFKYLHAERVLVPVREIDTNGQRRSVPLLAENREVIGENSDIRQLLKYRDDLSTLFSMQYLQPLRLSAIRDETDSSGYITHTTILPVGRTKRAVDTAFQLQPNSLLRILYVPIFRLTFNDKGEKMLCFANGDLTGLPTTVISRENSFDIQDVPHLSLGISIFLATAFAIVTIVSLNNSEMAEADVFNNIISIIGLSIILVIPTMAAIIVGFLFFSKLVVSLNVIKSIKQWLIRRTLSRKFRLKEKSK